MHTWWLQRQRSQRTFWRRNGLQHCQSLPLSLSAPVQLTLDASQHAGSTATNGSIDSVVLLTDALCCTLAERKDAAHSSCIRHVMSMKPVMSAMCVVTKESNGAACSGEDTSGARRVLLGCVLHGGHKETDAAGNTGSFTCFSDTVLGVGHCLVQVVVFCLGARKSKFNRKAGSIQLGEDSPLPLL